MKQKQHSIKLRLIGLMLIFWLLPFLLISIFTAANLSGRHLDDEVSLELSRLRFSSQVSTERLNTAVALSKSSTYSRVINNAYSSYNKGNTTLESFLSTTNAELTRLYGHQDTVRSAMFWLKEDPDIQTGMFNENSGGSYHSLSSFWRLYQEDMIKSAEELDTKILFTGDSSDQIFLVRNMLDSNYRTIGVIVLGINEDYCFQALRELDSNTDITISLDNRTYVLQGAGLSWKDVSDTEEILTFGSHTERDVLGLYTVEKEDYYTLTTMIRYNDLWQSAAANSYRTVLIIMVVLLVPMLILILYLFRTNITKPVRELVSTVEKIQDGNLGYRSNSSYNIKEFDYLGDSINKMSKRLKFQFDHIYEEEIALREARIMALESHINPHFLNNTLEIINWEARLNQDDKVADMIGWLSILTDSAMDRKKQSIISMKEEMTAVNAYLNILKTRFGDRLTVVNELNEDVMNCHVPRLILQPIIENAVEHGAAKHGTGIVRLTGKRVGDFLYLDIYNDGSITDKEKEKIKRLLDPNYDTSREPSGNLGIANVNQRLRILYGSSCGLIIEEAQGGVISRLIIREETHT